MLSQHEALCQVIKFVDEKETTCKVLSDGCELTCSFPTDLIKKHELFESQWFVWNVNSPKLSISPFKEPELDRNRLSWLYKAHLRRREEDGDCQGPGK